MLAGTVYFYNEKNEVIKEMDLEEYEALSEEMFLKLIETTGAFKVSLTAFSHNHHRGAETVLYEKNIKQT